MTSGGYRTASPRDTVARFRKHVSPLTGVVSALERIEADVPMNTNYHAAHNFSAPARTVDELREGLSGGSFGKGSTAERGEADALVGKLADTLAEIDEALTKLADGTYGTCESCGERIGEARMEAMPAARLCISCASRPR